MRIKQGIIAARRTSLCATCVAVLLLCAAPVFSRADKDPLPRTSSTLRSTSPKKSGSATGKSHTPARKATSKRKSHRRERAQLAPTSDRIQEIQAALAREGAYKGTPNGKWDAATVAAMKNFQSSQGFNPSGKLDARSLQKLGLGSEIAGRSAPRPPSLPLPASVIPPR